MNLSTHFCPPLSAAVRCNWSFPERKRLQTPRTRHSIEYDLTTDVTKGGKILAKDMKAYSNQVAYASHGHAIAANGATADDG